MKRVLVVGSLNMDLVTHVYRTPKIGETVLGEGFEEIPGGKGANQAVALSRLGADVTMLGRVGSDAFADTLIGNLKSNSVDVTLIEKVENAATGTALIMVNEDGDNSIVVISGANYELTEEMIEDDIFKGVEYVLAQLETPLNTIEMVFKKAKEKGITTVLNPAPARQLNLNLLENVDMLIPNETEFSEITGVEARDTESVEKGAAILFDAGIEEIIITLGKKGAYYLNKSGKRHKETGYKVSAVDTTAAGDSFIGGLLRCISRNITIEDSMAYAMKVGAVTVSRPGAQSSLPTEEDIEEFEGVKNG